MIGLIGYDYNRFSRIMSVDKLRKTYVCVYVLRQTASEYATSFLNDNHYPPCQQSTTFSFCVSGSVFFSQARMIRIQKFYRPVRAAVPFMPSFVDVHVAPCSILRFSVELQSGVKNSPCL